MSLPVLYLRGLRGSGSGAKRILREPKLLADDAAAASVRALLPMLVDSPLLPGSELSGVAPALGRLSAEAEPRRAGRDWERAEAGAAEVGAPLTGLLTVDVDECPPPVPVDDSVDVVRTLLRSLSPSVPRSREVGRLALCGVGEGRRSRQRGGPNQEEARDEEDDRERQSDTAGGRQHISHRRTSPSQTHFIRIPLASEPETKAGFGGLRRLGNESSTTSTALALLLVCFSSSALPPLLFLSPLSPPNAVKAERAGEVVDWRLCSAAARVGDLLLLFILSRSIGDGLPVFSLYGRI